MVYTIATLLTKFEAVGVFDLLLPFLLVFAIVYGILSASKLLGENKGIHVIIALVLGLLSLRFNFFSQFLSEIAPRLGIGIVVILTVLILIGLFIPTDETKRGYWMYGLAGLGIVVALVVIGKSFDFLGWLAIGGYATEDVIGFLIGAVLIGVIIFAIVKGNNGGGAPRGAAH